MSELISSGMILAIDTATPVCSVALADETAIHHIREQGSGVHSTRLGGMIQELLEGKGRNASSIETVLISSGPGSFTGLRIATSFVKGFLFQRKTTVIRASTLPVMAYDFVVQSTADGSSLNLTQSTPQITVHTVLDARRQHLYHWKGEFVLQDGKLLSVNEALDAKARELTEIEDNLQPGHLLGGLGIERLSEESRQGVITSSSDLIHAGSMIRAYLDPLMSSHFKMVDLATFAPDYLS